MPMQKKEGELQLLQEELTTQRAQAQLLEQEQAQAADRAAAAESNAADGQAKLQGQLAEAMTLLDQRGKQVGNHSCSPGRCKVVGWDWPVLALCNTVLQMGHQADTLYVAGRLDVRSPPFTIQHLQSSGVRGPAG